MQFSPTSRHLIPIWSKYSSQHPVLKHVTTICKATVCTMWEPRRLTTLRASKGLLQPYGYGYTMDSRSITDNCNFLHYG
jgi:hypothetical protein